MHAINFKHHKYIVTYNFVTEGVPCKNPWTVWKKHRVTMIAWVESTDQSGRWPSEVERKALGFTILSQIVCTHYWPMYHLGSCLEKAYCEKEYEIEPSKFDAFQSWNVWKTGMSCCSFCDLTHRDLRIFWMSCMPVPADTTIYLRPKLSRAIDALVNHFTCK